MRAIKDAFCEQAFSFREMMQRSECTGLLSSREFRFLDRFLQNLDGLVVGFLPHRIGITVFAAVGEGITSGILPGRLGSID